MFKNKTRTINAQGASSFDFKYFNYTFFTVLKIKCRTRPRAGPARHRTRPRSTLRDFAHAKCSASHDHEGYGSMVWVRVWVRLRERAFGSRKLCY